MGISWPILLAGAVLWSIVLVRSGELEATNYFFSLGDADNVLELTYNHDGRSYDLGTGYGHIAIAVDDLDGTLAALEDGHGIEPERPPYQVTEGDSRICFVRDPRRISQNVDLDHKGTFAPPRREGESRNGGCRHLPERVFRSVP